jgi:AcrR family transcriptional regulator
MLEMKISTLENFTTETMPETRERLTEAAGEVFAERGFRAATVRDICQRAQANVTAVPNACIISMPDWC